MDSKDVELSFDSDRMVSRDNEVLINLTGKSVILIGDNRKTIHCLRKGCNIDYLYSYSKVNNSFGIDITRVGAEAINWLPEVKEGTFYIVDEKALKFTLSTGRTVDDFLVVDDSNFNEEAGVYVCSNLRSIEYKYEFER